ncbi:MAG: TIGR01212 family radical SAM protein [Epsilonproteobacteria bacterium]|nr:MAG: TIGR01212 family radical SAM protein [Campylobacterota bacterium]
MRNLNTIGKYWRKKYGEKVYKIPISISGFTCPNIDGTVAKGGCTFCENDSFAPNLQKEKKSDFKLHPKIKENPLLGNQLLQLQAQFDKTKANLTKKFGAKKFIVYFQSFTNTYAPIETLKVLYEKALSFDDVVGLSIGTRTDSITEEILDYLVELQNQDKEIWVEYGIQSAYDEILEKINRGHDFANIKEWILKTKEKGLLVCGHMIFGLPDETQEMMIDSVKQSVALGIDSIKFHPLYVVKNTILTKDFNEGKFIPISEELYIDTLVKSIQLLPEDVSISRVTAGIHNDSLLAPMWCTNKHQQMYNIKKALLKVDLYY